MIFFETRRAVGVRHSQQHLAVVPDDDQVAMRTSRRPLRSWPAWLVVLMVVMIQDRALASYPTLTKHNTALSNRAPIAMPSNNSSALASEKKVIRHAIHQNVIYDWSKSTEDNYRSTITDHPPRGQTLFWGKYASIRKRLDYQYHAHYTQARQLFQDSIIDVLLECTWIEDAHGRNCSRPASHPWIVFTAGVMGAGKSHTVKLLARKGRFPLHSFVLVDPDEVRQRLPEFHHYVHQCPQLAGELTRKEAGMMVEILTEAALQQGQNVLVDGSLKDATWYMEYFDALRRSHPHLRIAIWHVTAPRELVLDRAMSRARATGRVVPTEILERAMEQVPQSVEILRHHVDFCVELFNGADGKDDVQIRTPGVSWHSFGQLWSQSCSVPHMEPTCRSMPAPSNWFSVDSLLGD